MSLIDGIIIDTIQSTESRHSLLMRFYQLDKDIEQRYNEVERPFFDLSLHLMRVQAKAILHALGII